MSRFGGLSERLTKRPEPAAEAQQPTEDRMPIAAAGQGRRPAREGKKFVGGWYSKGLSRDLAQIALDNDTSIQALVGEAIDLLLRQYGKHPRGER